MRARERCDDDRGAAAETDRGAGPANRRAAHRRAAIGPDRRTAAKRAPAAARVRWRRGSASLGQSDRRLVASSPSLACCWPACSTCVCCTVRSPLAFLTQPIERAIAEEVAGVARGASKASPCAWATAASWSSSSRTCASPMPATCRWHRAFRVRLAQPQGAAERAHRARERRSHLAAAVAVLRRGRHALAQVRAARRAPRERARQAAGRRAARPRRRLRRRRRRSRRRARPHRSRQDAVGDLRARAPARACQRLSARDRAASRPPSSSTRAAARASGACPSSASISTTGAAAAQIAGRAKIESLAGPWTLNFRTYEHETAKTLQLAVSVQGLVPRGLARTLPQLAGLEGLDVPVWGEAQPRPLQHRRDPERHHRHRRGARDRCCCHGWRRRRCASTAAIWRCPTDRAARRFEIAPSVLVWGDSRVQFTGSIVHTQQGPEGPGWAFDLKSAGGWLGAEPPLLPRLDDRRLVGARVRLAGARPRRAQPVPAAGRRRGGLRRRRRDGHGRRHAGAARRQDRGDAGRASSRRSGPRRWRRAAATGSVKRLVRGWLQGGSFRLATDAGDAAARAGPPHRRPSAAR